MLYLDAGILRTENVVNFRLLAPQRLDVLHQRPAFVGFEQIVAERGHRRARQTVGDAKIQVASLGAAAERADGEVARRQWNAPIVLERRRRRPVALTLLTVATETLQPGEDLLPFDERF